ncbi:alpha-1,4-glucan--maltose-1-phosphate maltosyltransferase [Dermabacteraceae bacterium P13115]
MSKADAKGLSAGIGRIPIVSVSPCVDGGRFPAKCVSGEAVTVTANTFREGHDAMGAQVVLTDPEGREVSRTPLSCVNPGLDLWQGTVVPTAEGMWSFHVEAFSDPYATWLHQAEAKIPAGVDVDLVFLEGVRVCDRALAEVSAGLRDKADEGLLLSVRDSLRSHSLQPSARLAPAASAEVREMMRQNPLRDGVTLSAPLPLKVERKRALYGSWYEIFPRSYGAHFDRESGRWVSGTLQCARKELPRIARMGFDVVYLTPIHPIGQAFKKGRNNTLDARPEDPGSPYAIGSADGGMEAIHPDLGSVADFADFVAEAKRLDLEVAMDIALQCSPDHPWVEEHPEWFSKRPDGSIAYAENPPKKYQDIYPLSFDTDYRGLYNAIRDILELWVSRGVTLFRVDNPHTKPVRFWEELLAEFAEKHPQVIFLAEAFTRPTMMHTLGKVGFHQSYTYYTWRHTPKELKEYLLELVEAAPYMRPSFWPTTHDILTPFMSQGGRNAFTLRAILAATLVPTWGIYSGYELVEDVPRPGAEEQIDNEKYEYKPRDFALALQEGRSLEPLLSRLNRIRREHPALQQLTAIDFHRADDERLLVFSKRDPLSDDTILVVALTEHQGDSYGHITLDLEALGVSGAQFQVEDLLTGERFTFDERPYIILTANHRPAHILRIVR